MLEPIRAQNLGSLLMKLCQSNFNLRSPDSYWVCSYLIATVRANLHELSDPEINPILDQKGFREW